MTIDDLGARPLPNGAEARFVRVTAPDATYAGKLAAFFSHKGWPWVDDVAAVIAGRHGPEPSDTFHLAEIKGGPAASVWVSASPKRPHTGLLGHVYTSPEMRRQGLAHELMLAAEQHFESRGGRRLLLSTDNPSAARLYERHGFRIVRGDLDAGDNCVMARGAQAPQPAPDAGPLVRPAMRADLADLVALYALQGPLDAPLDWALGMECFTKAEERLVEGFCNSLSGKCRLFVLEKAGAIAAAASLVSTCDGRLAFDCLGPDLPAADLEGLVAAALAAAGEERAAIRAAAFTQARQHLLASAGFSASGRGVSAKGYRGACEGVEMILEPGRGA